MRTSLLVAACGLFVAGCSSTPEPTTNAAMAAVPPPNVAFYAVAPAGSAQLGPINVSLCNGTRPVMTRKLLDEAARLGGNGIVQLSCRTDKMSASCLHTAVCTGVAINVPPPPPPVQRRPTRRR